MLGNIDGITLGLNDRTELGSLDESFDDSNAGKLEWLLLVYSLEYSGGSVLSSDEGIKLGVFYDKVLGTILGNVYWITLGV